MNCWKVVILGTLLSFMAEAGFCGEPVAGSPRINSPTVVGVRPGTPFLFAIPVTGERPMKFGARDLPSALTLDVETGLITGTVADAGEFVVTLTAANSKGGTESRLRIAVGDKLALTPPMGWMSWNLFGPKVSEVILKEMADAMVSSRMRDAGYQYIAIDDDWQGERDIKDDSSTEGRLRPDPQRFPNGIKPVADYLHARGLKLGIYTDASNKTCEQRSGSLGFEEIDAETFASWGIDYVKEDYCYAPKDQKTAFNRYSQMADALRHSGRSIVFGICEWGFRQPWLWGEKAGGNLWRTYLDVRDTWYTGIDKEPYTGILNILDKQVDLWRYAGPGHWNDPDMLVVGLYGKGMYTSPENLPPLNDVEYQSQVSLWSLLAAPLFATNDLRSMNKATLNILTNTEVIAIDQDPLGQQAKRVAKNGDLEVWSRDLADGSKAVGLLNRGPAPARIKVNWSDIGIESEYHARDLWQHSELGTFRNSIEAEVQSHETKLLRLSKAK